VFSPAPLDSMGRLTILCLPAQWIQVMLSRGGGPTFQPRTMRSGPNQLAYNLYLDAARAAVWGDGTQGTQAFQGVGWWFSLPIYGRIPAAQDVAVGSNADRHRATNNI
jgi:spore coat protein U-like protein